IAGFINLPGKLPIQRPVDVRKRRNAIGQLAWRDWQERQRASRGESNSKQLYGTSWRNMYGLSHLADDKARWLQIRGSRFFVLREKGAEIQNQLDTTVRENPLRLSGFLLIATLKQPNTLHMF